MLSKTCVMAVLVTTWSTAFTYSCRAEDEPQKIELLQVPVEAAFKTALETKSVNQVLEWMSDLEANFMVDRHDVVVRGEFGRELSMGGKARPMLMQHNFRFAQSELGNNVRIISSLQDMMANPGARNLMGVMTDGCVELDTLKLGEKGFRKYRQGPISTMQASEIEGTSGYRPVFHPFRAAVTSVDQVLNAGSQDLEKHSVRKKTIKRIAKQGKTTFVWLEIGGSRASTRRIVAFQNGCPVQVTNWSRLDPVTRRPVAYDTIRTVWKEAGDKWIPVRMYGVRKHKVRPAEFTFTFEWNIGDKVDAELFKADSVGKVEWSGVVKSAVRR